VRGTAVELATADGVVVRALELGGGDRWIVLAHAEGDDLDAWSAVVPALTDLGLHVLALDLRGHGASDDPWTPAFAWLDVDAAMRFAADRGAGRLYAMGAGIGATAALIAGGDHRLSAIVLLSPAEEPAGTAPDAVRRCRAAKLLVAGARDPDAVAAARRLSRRTIGWSMLETPPVAEQGTALFRSAWGDHVREHVALFLARGGAGLAPA
jgi:alpha-beta hydrolase superfamily lysophospholipase